MSARLSSVLVTGSGGFVGRAAVAALRKRGVTVREWPRDVDLLDEKKAAEAVRAIGASHLLHLAWYTEHGVYWSSPLNETWVDASMSLFRAFLDAGGERIVGAGTCAEYDWSAGRCIEGVTPIAPATVYGAAKVSLHRQLEALTSSYAWARIFFLYGPHEAPQRFVASTIRSLLANEPVACRDGSLQRDFLYIDDAGEAMAAIVCGDATGAVNVGSGVALPLGEIASRVAEKLSARERLHVLERSSHEAQLVVADTTRLANGFGFRASIGLDDGLSRTIDWWRAA
jgi:nucleoside-diphosphate-sugar epimerase